MMKYSLAKVIVSIVLVVSWVAMPQFTFPGDGISGHLLYPISHANIFHLLANVLCLWMIPCGLHLSSAYLVAVTCSFLPCYLGEPTMGFSGVLFAIVGMSWGRVRRFREMLWRNKYWLIIPMFIPHINALLHIWCLLAGWVVGRIWQERLLPCKLKDWL